MATYSILPSGKMDKTGGHRGIQFHEGEEGLGRIVQASP
jgi:hypothetical protein